jgi:phage gp36-like protein
MADPFATAQDLLDRIDEVLLAQLTSANGTTTDTVKLTNAVADASAVLNGYLRRVPRDSQPDADTLKTHCVTVALYYLAIGRPGKEFESIRNGYNDVIAFYKDLVAAAQSTVTSPLGLAGSAPPEVFSEPAMSGFVPRV